MLSDLCGSETFVRISNAGHGTCSPPNAYRFLVSTGSCLSPKLYICCSWRPTDCHIDQITCVYKLSAFLAQPFSTLNHVIYTDSTFSGGIFTVFIPDLVCFIWAWSPCYLNSQLNNHFILVSTSLHILLPNQVTDLTRLLSRSTRKRGGACWCSHYRCRNSHKYTTWSQFRRQYTDGRYTLLSFFPFVPYNIGSKLHVDF